MKTIRWVAVLVILGGAGPVWGQGFDEVLLTRHNLFPGGPDSLVRDVCLVCHLEPIVGISPRVAEALPMGIKIQGTDVPLRTQASPVAPPPDFGKIPSALWDAQNPVRVYLPRPVVKPDPVKRTSFQLPFGPSFDCLTCHDGVLGGDVHRLGSGGRLILGRSADTDRELGRPTDHPDSVIYPRKPSGEFSGRNNEVRLERYWSIPDRNPGGLVVPDGPMSDYMHLDEVDLDDPLQTAGLIRTFEGIIHCDSCHNPHLNAHRPFLRVPPKDLCLTCHQR